jgi:hypothetical protein
MTPGPEAEQCVSNYEEIMNICTSVVHYLLAPSLRLRKDIS